MTKDNQDDDVDDEVENALIIFETWFSKVSNVIKQPSHGMVKSASSLGVGSGLLEAARNHVGGGERTVHVCICLWTRRF